MTFDKTLPSNTTKIRNYPSVLTDNFKAIEEGLSSFRPWSINFAERNGVAPSNDPTRIDDTIILYSKQDADGDTELYLLDDRSPANTIQLSEDGSLGSQTTPLYGSSIRLDNDASALLLGINNMIVAAGSVAVGGSASGVNVASGSLASFQYTVKITADVLLNSNYRVIATPTTDARVVDVITKPTPSGGSTTDIVFRTRDTRGDNATSSFDFIVVGGR